MPRLVKSLVGRPNAQTLTFAKRTPLYRTYLIRLLYTCIHWLHLQRQPQNLLSTLFKLMTTVNIPGGNCNGNNGSCKKVLTVNLILYLLPVETSFVSSQEIREIIYFNSPKNSLFFYCIWIYNRNTSNNYTTLQTITTLAPNLLTQNERNKFQTIYPRMLPTYEHNQIYL